MAINALNIKHFDGFVYKIPPVVFTFMLLSILGNTNLNNNTIHNYAKEIMLITKPNLSLGSIDLTSPKPGERRLSIP